MDDAGVEPGVADLGDPLDLGAAVLAADADGVDPRPVQLLELLEPRDGALLELGARADHVQLPALALVERQRQPEEAAAGDVPVAHVAQPVVHPLLVLGRRPLHGRVAVEHRLPDLVGGNEPVVDDAEDEGRPAAPADRVAVGDRGRLDEQMALAQRLDHRIDHFLRRLALQLAVAGQHPPGLVDRRKYRQVVDSRELEVLRPGPGRDVDDARALVERDLVPGDHPVDDTVLGGELVEGPLVLETDELFAAHALLEVLVGIPRDGDPLTDVVAPVLRVGLDRGRDVRRERPRRRRPDDQRLALAPAKREADEERRMLDLCVVLVARLLVFRERGAAARAPLRCVVALVQPTLLLDGLEEAPDVRDVRVAEREVVVAPVHPHPEPLRLRRLDAGELRDEVAAVAREPGEAVLLDLALRVEAERLLDLDFDVEALRVEAVLVAELVAVGGLVALKDVLQRPAQAVMDAGGPVRRDRPVHEGEGRAVAVLLAELVERGFRLPAHEHLPLQSRMIRFVR